MTITMGTLNNWSIFFHAGFHFLEAGRPIPTDLRPHRVTYFSPQSQNEFINILACEARKILIDHIHSSGVYIVMADTTHDLSHADQISLIIRHVDEKFQVQQRLLKISEINVKTGDGFAEKVIRMLNDLGLPLVNL